MKTSETIGCGLAFLILMAVAAHADESPTLKAAAGEDFRVGAAIGSHHLAGEEPQAWQLVVRQFNSITPENALKWESVHPQSTEYDFRLGDELVRLGGQAKMFIVGHALIWHQQTPAWVFQDEQGNPATRETLIARMREHIHRVVGHYQGQIHAWDVVNEGLDDDGQLRNTPWLSIIGEDYLKLAFQFAREADPQAQLYYNDYSLTSPSKRDAAAALVRKLRAQGVRVDGLGMQGHWGLVEPNCEEIEQAIVTLSDVAPVMITELEIDVLPHYSGGADLDVTKRPSAKWNPYVSGLPAEVRTAQAKRYGDVFAIFQKHHDRITRVTFWGIHDGHSWKNDWPIRGRTNYPLLFDRKLQTKPCFDAAVRALQPMSAKPDK